MSERVRIAAYLNIAHTYAREIRLGMGRCEKVEGSVVVQGRPFNELGKPGLGRKLRKMGIQVVVAEVSNRRTLGRLRRMTLPVVNISERLEPRLPSVLPDQDSVGALAAEHLMEKGLDALAFVGQPGFAFAQARWAGFAGRARTEGIEPACWGVGMRDRPEEWEDWHKGRPDWLASLPSPSGLLAADDELARLVLQELDSLDRDVPNDVAVLGVNNDELACELASPTLTSIDLDAGRVGHEAAALAERLARGVSPPAQPVRIPPLGVISRGSTESLAISDPHVRLALEYIRSHAESPLTVDEVVQHVSISRRSLEIRFRRIMGRTLHAEIQRTHVQKARQLLAQTDLPVTKVAEACGFSRLKQLTETFTRHEGVSPRDYRKQFRSE
ncbi:MAG: substrate-binding domain-containing protein [Phycisphaerae bacterium]